MSSPAIPRPDRPDSCPGALRLHAAEDGHLARVRLPGGELSAAALVALAAFAADRGGGHLEVTSRASVQVRELPPSAAAPLAALLCEHGLLPSPAHERVRNVLVSPLTGLDAVGTLDVAPLARAFDALLCADPATAALSGRFLFAFDDGRGDVAALAPDLGWRAVSGDEGVLSAAGAARGLRVDAAEAPAAMVAAARRFLRLRGAAERVWRIRDLPDGADSVLAELPHPAAAGVLPPGEPPAPGVVPGPDGSGAVVLGAPFGRYGTAQALAVVAELADGGSLRITPWRGMVLGRLPHAAGARERLRAAGLVVDPASPWLGVTACAGLGRCATARADVRSDAARSVTLGTGAARRRVHWSGCARRCGRPSGEHLDVLSLDADRYEITDPSTTHRVSAGSVPARVAELRTRS